MRNFDLVSGQSWTRSLGAWLPREAICSLVLRIQNRL